MTGMVYNILKSPKELKPHKTNTQIYGTEIVDADLVESIKNKGILEPIVILEDDTILSGHRRWLAAKELKLERVPCRSMSFSDELDEKEALIEFNRQRSKTYSQRMNEADLLTSVYSERAKKRHSDLSYREHTNKSEAVLTSAPPKQNDTDVRKTRDIVAEKVGLKKDTYTKVKKVWDTAKSGDTYAKSLVEKLDKKEVTANEAHNRIKTFQEAPEPVKKRIVEEDMTAKEAIKEIKKEERIEQKKIQQQTPTKELPDSEYELILA
ncbi:MAG: ParB N-terminal domain-containing protein, partial [Desulfobacterales bacterium]|nr:ParB N-terminal domain-containing protein [Desulfobacterales bacterium]